MPARTDRPTLTRGRVLAAARDLADRDGIDALTMRRLAEALGVEAMSLYHHLPNKDAILDGLVELGFDEIVAEVGDPGPSEGAAWQPVLRARALGARRVLLRHRWLAGLLEQRPTIAPSMVRYVDATVGVMLAGGFSHDLAHHALHALGSRMFGFTQELPLDDDSTADIDMELFAAAAPHLSAMLAEVVHDAPEQTLGWCDDQTEFEFGLDIVLDGLERRRRALHGPATT